MSIRAENLSKTYGSQVALNEVSFTADKGEVIGLLGPNGAGKSTLMKILTGSISADHGTAIINDFNIHSDRLNAQKGDRKSVV